ncbi:hypothetical protein [Neptuniibacter sp.]|uniref:hypothetical protein n=1 Tax=Neptuniibacter sp. TaxID=1962643 RepID=UPI0026282862|nr:hypothetical protein [Neptuniibacter sp.]MCP4597189.1 helix-turn-helix domain-containing protein [Neptuniibacter sp.]
MPGKHANISQIKEILALRAVGATRASIAASTGVSYSTISRICKRFSAPKGHMKDRLVKEAQQRINNLCNDEKLQQATACMIVDDIVLNKLIREKITEAVLSLDTTNPHEAANALRALNSASSAAVSTQKAARIATGADKFDEYSEELPELTIKVMDDADVAQVRDRLQSEDLDDE